MKRFVFLTLTLLWMAFIFGMSAQQGEQSGELSNKVCKAICYVVVDGYGEMDSWTQQQYIDRLSYPVRKGAHMTEYAVLGLFLMETTYSFRFDKLRKKRGKRRKGFFGQCLQHIKGKRRDASHPAEYTGHIRSAGISAAVLANVSPEEKTGDYD